MSTTKVISQYYLDVLVNAKLGDLRDDTLEVINSVEFWLNDIIRQTQDDSCIKKKFCEICGSESKHELHHIAGRKHDFRIITACKACHEELSESQKTWDARWYKTNQPEHIKNAFFLLGLHDILLLKSRKTANSIYEELAKSFRQDIATLLTRDQRLD